MDSATVHRVNYSNVRCPRGSCYLLKTLYNFVEVAFTRETASGAERPHFLNT